MHVTIRKSTIKDIDDLLKIEQKSFPEFQQNSKRSLQLSLSSTFQEVWVAEKNLLGNKKIIGTMILFKYKRSLRVYSIAVLPDYQSNGIGTMLIEHTKKLAISYNCEKIILEAHLKNNTLIEWYHRKGFVNQSVYKDYYKLGEDAQKMIFVITNNTKEITQKNLLVVNNTRQWTGFDINAKIISVKEYISNEEFHINSSIRIFNLCNSYQYQSYGYYVSLLAAARGQRVIPNVTTIRDFKSLGIVNSISSEIDDLIQKTLEPQKAKRFEFEVYFGQTEKTEFKKLALKLYKLFETPLFRISFIYDERWIVKKIQALNMNKINDCERQKVTYYAKQYFDKKRFNKAIFKSYKYDLAILINPQEANPPSCKDALQKFKEAANRKGLYVEFITKNDFDKINEFDALFIRETTSVDNHTYELSRLAYSEGLVVIDDPWSIMRCSNKIYQNELFKQNKILTPKTRIHTKSIYTEKELDDVVFPVVIKQPDSAFSLGITKANSREEMNEVLLRLFKKSDMIISQQFMYSEFDWRIGIIDNTPIFACKYFMSKGHWQIYNWNENKEEFAGNSETLAISDVPQKIVDTALKASSLIGDGLYGVDLKEINGKVYVIEVNDNPNIDESIEDAVLKNKLYDIIIDSIYNKIEISKNIKRYISN